MQWPIYAMNKCTQKVYSAILNNEGVKMSSAEFIPKKFRGLLKVGICWSLKRPLPFIYSYSSDVHALFMFIQASTCCRRFNSDGFDWLNSYPYLWDWDWLDAKLFSPLFYRHIDFISLYFKCIENEMGRSFVTLYKFHWFLFSNCESNAHSRCDC